MQNKKLIRFVESFILLPFITTTVPASNQLLVPADMVHNTQTVLSQKQNIETPNLFAFNQAVDEKAKTQALRAEAIDAYFKSKEMPLFGTGMKMVIEAEKNGLDWRLLLAITVRESTGGKFDCKNVTNNPFGWGSCKIGFNSIDEAIEIVARKLGGNNPNTVRHYYNKTTKQILRAYNPPSIVPRYAEQVLSIMNDIGVPDLGIVVANS